MRVCAMFAMAASSDRCPSVQRVSYGGYNHRRTAGEHTACFYLTSLNKLYVVIHAFFRIV